MMLPIVKILVETGVDKYYGIQHGLKKDFDPHVDKTATYF